MGPRHSVNRREFREEPAVYLVDWPKIGSETTKPYESGAFLFRKTLERKL